MVRKLRPFAAALAAVLALLILDAVLVHGNPEAESDPRKTKIGHFERGKAIFLQRKMSITTRITTQRARAEKSTTTIMKKEKQKGKEKIAHMLKAAEVQPGEIKVWTGIRVRETLSEFTLQVRKSCVFCRSHSTAGLEHRRNDRQGGV